MEIANARVLIVGATGALGGLVATELAQRGAKLVASGRNVQRLSEVAQQTGAHAIAADLTDPNAPAHLVGDAQAHLNGLDAVVQCAGVVAFGEVHDLDDTTLTTLLQVNLRAPIAIARAAANTLEEGGVIAQVSAIVADMPTAGMAAYSASKAGLSAFTVAHARELRRRKIRVLDIRPGHLDTGLEQRPIAGTSPSLPQGAPALHTAVEIVDAMANPKVRKVPA